MSHATLFTNCAASVIKMSKRKQFLELTTAHLCVTETSLCVLKQREPQTQRKGLSAMQEIRFTIAVSIRTGLRSKITFRMVLRLKLGLKWRRKSSFAWCLESRLFFSLSCWKGILLCSSSTLWDSEKIFRTSYWSSWWVFSPAWISVFVHFWIVWFGVVTALSALNEVSSLYSD